MNPKGALYIRLAGGISDDYENETNSKTMRLKLRVKNMDTEFKFLDHLAKIKQTDDNIELTHWGDHDIKSIIKETTASYYSLMALVYNIHILEPRYREFRHVKITLKTTCCLDGITALYPPRRMKLRWKQ